MENKFDVVIISAFGRGHWLAHECVSAGLSVALVDVSDEMGKWSLEDWEGPFGVFRHGSLSASQAARLEEDARLEMVERGFTIWSKQGPIELHSRLTPYLLAQHQVDPDSREYLEQASRFEAFADRGALKKKLTKIPFENGWLCHFAHQFASNTFVKSAEGLSSGEPLALFSDWVVRRVSAEGLEVGWKKAQSKGVRVLPHSRILDVGLNSGQIDAIEIKNVEAGLIHGSHFIWALSSEDSLRFASPVQTKLFPTGVLESEWAWVRYQLKLATVPHMEPLPLKFVFMENVFLPWAHANMSVVTRTDTPDVWDAWVRIPTQSRFQRGYLEKMIGELIALMGQRVPGLEPTVHQMPPDYVHNLNDIGAPRFPVFNRERLKNFKASSYRNFYFAGPEAWANLDWSAQFAQHAQIFTQIRDLWIKEREREQRRQKT